MEDKTIAFREFCRGYELLSPRDKDMFAKVSNRILNKTFIQKDKKEDFLYYAFCVEHLDTLQAHFALIDYRIDYYSQDMLLQLKTTSDRNRFRLKKLDTVILLLLRQIYTEKSKEVSLEDGIFASINELHEALKNKNLVTDRVGKTDLQNSLRVLKKYSIIEYNVSKISDDDSVIKIYPSIIYTVNINDMTTLKERIEKYKVGADANEEINED